MKTYFLTLWPTYATNQNHLNNFGRGPSRDYSCKVWSKSNEWFQRRRCLSKKSLGMTDDDGQRPVTIAHPEHFVLRWAKNPFNSKRLQYANCLYGNKSYNILLHFTEIWLLYINIRSNCIQKYVNFKIKVTVTVVVDIVLPILNCLSMFILYIIMSELQALSGHFQTCFRWGVVGLNYASYNSIILISSV